MQNLATHQFNYSITEEEKFKRANILHQFMWFENSIYKNVIINLLLELTSYDCASPT